MAARITQFQNAAGQQVSGADVSQALYGWIDQNWQNYNALQQQDQQFRLNFAPTEANPYGESPFAAQIRDLYATMPEFYSLAVDGDKNPRTRINVIADDGTAPQWAIDAGLRTGRKGDAMVQVYGGADNNQRNFAALGRDGTTGYEWDQKINTGPNMLQLVAGGALAGAAVYGAAALAGGGAGAAGAGGASAGTAAGAAGAGAGEAAAAGWISAEGGAGYLGGLAADSAAVSAGNAGMLASGAVQTATAAGGGAGVGWVPAEGGAGYLNGAAADTAALNSGKAGMLASGATQAAAAPAAATPTLTGGATGIAGTGFTLSDAATLGGALLSLGGSASQVNAMNNASRQNQEQIANMQQAIAGMAPPTAPPVPGTPAGDAAGVDTDIMRQAQAAGVPISDILRRRNQSGLGGQSTWLTGPGGIAPSWINTRANMLLGL